MVDGTTACRLRRRLSSGSPRDQGAPTYKKAPACGAVAGQDNAVRDLGWVRRALSATGMERGRRRTRQDQISTGVRAPVKLRTSRSAPNEENLFLLPDRFSKERTLRTMIQPFDLMSRRHPLSSTRAIFQNLLREANRPEGSCDVPASSRRQFSRSEITSSSWRPCGSSSQSSSLRSSPSLPS
jgi:hypothetical protein